jgi:small subunit ribosomal protein S20
MIDVTIIGGGGERVPNIKSSEKRVLIGRARQARNKADRSELKTTIKKFEAAVSGGDSEAAAATYKAAVKSVDRAVSKGLIHKNNAARKKSKLTTKFNGITA